MGRAQVVQGGVQDSPSALMNPILLKPTADKHAQLFAGEGLQNKTAAEYHAWKPCLREMVRETTAGQQKFDIIVIEGREPGRDKLAGTDLVHGHGRNS